jgi:hypothetical protein
MRSRGYCQRAPNSGFDAFERAVSAVVAGPRSQAVSETSRSASQIPFKRIVFFLEDAAWKARQFSCTSRAHSFVFGAARKLRACSAASSRPENFRRVCPCDSRKFIAAAARKADYAAIVLLYVPIVF